MLKRIVKISLGIVLIFLAVYLLYPREVIFAPETEITIVFENEQIVPNADAQRWWGTYLDNEGLITDYTQADKDGKIRFQQVKGRVPLVLQWLKFVSTLLSPHDYPSSSGRILARDMQNHFIWQSISYENENCCPSKITIKKQDWEISDSFIGIKK
jgi:hypothetical protein